MFYSNNFKNLEEIQHCFFSRKNGNSKGIYESLNCGIGSKDDSKNVDKNLEIIAKNFKIQRSNLILMNQTHSNNVKIIKKESGNIKVNADAIVTTKDNLALGVLTADCAPILFFETKKKIIGCIHAGWKGAINGIIENTIEKIKELGGEINKVRVCIGPCIDKKNYEVKKDFYQNFKQKSENSDIFFSKGRNDSFYFDLRGFITKKFNNNGILQVDNINIDSFSSPEEYFSHRRAKKLGENDYGRCISVIKKIIVQN